MRDRGEDGGGEFPAAHLLRETRWPSGIPSVKATPTATLIHLSLPERVSGHHLLGARPLSKGVLESVDSEVAAPGPSFASTCDMHHERVQGRQRPFDAAMVKVLDEASHQLALPP